MSLLAISLVKKDITCFVIASSIYFHKKSFLVDTILFYTFLYLKPLNVSNGLLFFPFFTLLFHVAGNLLKNRPNNNN